METYTIVPHARAGTYQVVATAGDGKRRVVLACPTEQAAVTMLKRLQERSGTVPKPERRIPSEWRY